jgi:hypothetical protein
MSVSQIDLQQLSQFPSYNYITIVSLKPILTLVPRIFRGYCGDCYLSAPQKFLQIRMCLSTGQTQTNPFLTFYGILLLSAGIDFSINYIDEA